MLNQEMTTVQKTIDTVVAFFVNYSFEVLGALIVLVLGFMIANWLGNLIFGAMQKKNIDITLAKFLSGALRLIVLGFAVIIAMGKFGISTSPLIAAISAMAFGASFAFSGPLSNYGAGLSIVLTRPFAVGNTITVKDVSGVVDDIKLASTRLVNEDGVTITIPNSQIVGEVLYNSKQSKVVEGVVGISYDCQPETAIAAVRKVLAGFPEVTQDPAPQVGIEKFADSSLNIGFRYWVPTVKYFQLSYAVNLAIFKAFQEQKISIPFPQQEVRILSQPVS